jgi:hypothetical protein
VRERHEEDGSEEGDGYSPSCDHCLVACGIFGDCGCLLCRPSFMTAALPIAPAARAREHLVPILVHSLPLTPRPRFLAAL